MPKEEKEASGIESEIERIKEEIIQLSLKFHARNISVEKAERKLRNLSRRLDQKIQESIHFFQEELDEALASANNSNLVRILQKIYSFYLKEVKAEDFDFHKENDFKSIFEAFMGKKRASFNIFPAIGEGLCLGLHFSEGGVKVTTGSPNFFDLITHKYWKEGQKSVVSQTIKTAERAKRQVPESQNQENSLKRKYEDQIDTIIKGGTAHGLFAVLLEINNRLLQKNDKTTRRQEHHFIPEIKEAMATMQSANGGTYIFAMGDGGMSRIIVSTDENKTSIRVSSVSTDEVKEQWEKLFGDNGKP